MDSKYLFLNNSISLMLDRDVRNDIEVPKEWQAEQKKWEHEAQLIINNPKENIDVDEILKRSTLYTDVAGSYIDLFVKGTDAEQLKELHVIDAAAAMILLPPPLVTAGKILINEKDFSRWCDILKDLRYVPIQKAFCYNLRSHEDFMGVLNEINMHALAFPLTFLWSFLNYWHEWIVQTFVKLDTYEDHRHIYDGNETALALKIEAQTIREGWEQQLPKMVDQILKASFRFFEPIKLLIWATKKHLRDDGQGYPYNKYYNRITELICKELIDHIDFEKVPTDGLNLNMLVLLAEKVVEIRNESLSKTVYKQLLSALLKENFTNMDKKSIIDNRRQMVIVKLMDYITHSQNYSCLIDEIATKFEGWNLDYHKVYEESNREAYLLCSLFRLFEVRPFSENELFPRWKEIVDISMREYMRCNNDYIKADEFCVPFRVAVEVVEKLNNENCREYLHDCILTNVLSIVAVLRIFSECSLKLSFNTIKKLQERIIVEWPSAEILMEARGQSALKIRIQSLIDDIENAIK